jgi:hypothetical protein
MKPSDLVVRLKADAVNLRKQAEGMPSKIRREELLRKACQIEITAHVIEGAASPCLARPNEQSGPHPLVEIYHSTSDLRPPKTPQ